MTDKKRRFWEACDLILTSKGLLYGDAQVVESDGHIAIRLPDINSLDDLFRYAVPKLGYYADITFRQRDDGYTCVITIGHEGTTHGNAETPAQSLYEALCKALEVEG